MQEDNLNPNSGFFSPFASQENKPKKQTVSGKSYIRSAVKQLEAKITHYSSVDAIPVDLNEEPSTHQKRVALAQMMKAELTPIKERLEDLLDK